MGDWRTRLRDIIAGGKPAAEKDRMKKSRQRIAEFIEQTVIPAFRQLEEELKRQGREVTIDQKLDHASLTVFSQGEEEFSYAIRGHAYHKMTVAYPEIAEPAKQPWIYRAEVQPRSGRENYPMSEMTQEDIIEDFLNEYAKWKGW